jgi:ABC-type lipoprotein export system ATPase subunit
MLKLEGITKTYRGPQAVEALREIDLALEAGDFIAVQGPSGSGKTTLLLIAGGLLEPESGRVLVEGVDVYALSNESRARLRASRVGFVFQQFHLLPYLSVLDNVLAPILAMPSADAAGRARELIGRLGLGPRERHVPAELSTGERQRTALARALLNRPRLLFADEPTGNLDAANAKIVLDALAEFARAGGAVLMVTHDAAVAARAGRVVRLVAGRLDAASNANPVAPQGPDNLL